VAEDRLYPLALAPDVGGQLPLLQMVARRNATKRNVSKSLVIRERAAKRRRGRPKSKKAFKRRVSLESENLILLPSIHYWQPSRGFTRLAPYVLSQLLLCL
jgi:hypothetical protein